MQDLFCAFGFCALGSGYEVDRGSLIGEPPGLLVIILRLPTAARWPGVHKESAVMHDPS